MHMTDIPDLGYTLSPGRRPSEPGFSKLTAVLRDAPSGMHFDPEYACLSVAADGGSLASLAVQHPWNGELRYRACAGQINLIDRKGKQVDLFTFGSDVSLTVKEEETRLVLVSLAPLLLSREYHSAPALLAQETEILLAQRRAHWQDAPEEFDHRLCQVEPLSLYFACLHTILQRFERMDQHALFSVQFKQMLKTEIEAVESQVPLSARHLQLDEIL
jgi:hypothetical protein